MSYQAPDPKAWQGRRSSTPLYVHQFIQMLPLDRAIPPKAGAHALLGYACDEGVARNQGRVGAKEGPAAFRKALGRLPWHGKNADLLWDAGDLRCDDHNLEATQQALSTSIKELLAAGLSPIVIGGGHDIGFGHYCGLRAHLGPKARIGIINFDAHFDLRTPEPQATSGTPFFQVAKDCQALGLPFDYLCLGIRKDANDASLFECAKDLGARWIEHRDPALASAQALQPTLDAFLEPVDALYVTVCLDVFSSAYSPGVSAAYPHGMHPEQVFSLLEPMLTSPKRISCDIAELSPPWDRDHQSAKLAAVLALQMMEQMPVRG